MRFTDELCICIYSPMHIDFSRRLMWKKVFISGSAFLTWLRFSHKGYRLEIVKSLLLKYPSFVYTFMLCWTVFVYNARLHVVLFGVEYAMNWLCFDDCSSGFKHDNFCLFKTSFKHDNFCLFKTSLIVEISNFH